MPAASHSTTSFPALSPPAITESDIDEARRINAKLFWLPRFRMQTVFGRLVLNVFLFFLELYPLLKGLPRGARRELRTIRALDREVKLRIFRPPGTCRGVVLDIHGGGWTIGNARMGDHPNAQRAARTGLTIVSIDYRLAIWSSVDAVVSDCEAAAVWTLRNLEPEFGTRKMAVNASSAGAHLAALTMLRLRDRHGLADRISGAVMLFGLYDFSGTRMIREASADTLILHGPTVRATLCKLTPDMTDDERRDPSISPLYADLTSMPPALFVVGERDPVLEDNQRMEARWREANGNADIFVLPETPHAFDRLSTSIARKTLAYTDAWLLTSLERPDGDLHAARTDTATIPSPAAERA